jgi:predicted phosphoribosyltransferase
VILVDDGLATGSTMEAAVKAVRQLSAARVVVAAPVGSREACQALVSLADEMICAHQPDRFSAVAQWYVDFPQINDETVESLLVRARQAQSATQP